MSLSPTWFKPGHRPGKSGTAIHRALAHAVRTGKVLDDEWAEHVRQAQKVLRRLSPRAQAEVRIQLKTVIGEAWRGRLDVFDLVGPLDAWIIDWKVVRSKGRIPEDPSLFLDDPQLCSYAEWAFQNGGVSENGIVRVSFVYIDTETKQQTLMSGSWDRNTAREGWAALQRLMRREHDKTLTVDQKDRADRYLRGLHKQCVAGEGFAWRFVK